MTWTSDLGNTYTRQPAWDPPPPIHHDAQISRQITPVDPPAARDRTEDPDQPLWRDPTDGHREPKPARTPPQPEPRTGSWDDSPPPF